MDLQQLLNSITLDIYQQLQKAVEIGKWPDGRSMSDEQRSLCMQAIIAYDQRNPETERTGYVPPKESACAPEDKPKPIKWDH
jgi:uncharacterized protein YeaC (DUF1315 family)